MHAGGHRRQLPERDPLNPNGGNENPYFPVVTRCMYTTFFRFFYILCTITGQLPVKLTDSELGPKWFFKVIAALITTLITGLLILVNVGSLVFDLYVIIWCPYEHCGYMSVIRNSGNKPNGSELQIVQVPNLTIFEDWQKTVLTTATASGTISYLFMIYVLYSQYSVFKDIICDKCKDRTRSMWGKCGENLAEMSLGVLKSPFKDDSNRLEASRLSPKQACYYMVIFLLNMLIYCGNVALLFIIFGRSVDERQKTQESIDALGLTFQFVSQLCAIFSCFIFSKVAYSVGSTCVNKLPELFQLIDRGENQSLIDSTYIDPEDEDYTANDRGGRGQNKVYLLKMIVKWYNSMLNTTLNPFGTWFAVHWVLYTITAFMSISYVAETIILELYGKEDADVKCHGETHLSCRLKLAYVFLFAIEHCILFLYPCFRAASVTTAYTAMIKKVSNDHWVNISADDKEKFLNYLKIQDCTFRISVLCAKLSFGFNVAYFSIFVGILGVTLKLAL